MFNTNSCLFSGDFFQTISPNKTCKILTDGAGEYGLQILLTYYLNELKALYFYFKLLQKLADYFQFSYNLTLTGLEKEKDLWPEGARFQRLYLISHPINLFNKPENAKILFMFRFILEPLLQNFNYLIQTIAQSTSKSTIYLDTFVLILTVILYILVYFLLWKRHESQIEESIFKTKKMLRIIPVGSLVKIKNIAQIILNIDMLDDVNGKRTNKIWK